MNKYAKALHIELSNELTQKRIEIAKLQREIAQIHTEITEIYDTMDVLIPLIFDEEKEDA